MLEWNGEGKGSAICQGFTDGAALCREAKRERGSWLQAQSFTDSHRFRYDYELQHSRTPFAIALRRSVLFSTNMESQI